MLCNICNSNLKYIFSAKVLGKYYVAYFHCDQCKLLQTEYPYWIEEAYSNTAIGLDTGVIFRNNYLASQTAVLLYFLFDSQSVFLDFAGGYGILTRMMRDLGFDFTWSDLYATNLFAKGFEYQENQKVELLTAFECFEHFVNPLEEIEKLLQITDNILFTTELLPTQIPNPQEWWYYALDGGQHISLYSLETLQFIANKYNLNLLTDKRFIHLLTKKNIPDLLFKSLIKYNKLFQFYVRKQMKSKTDDDFHKFKSQIFIEDKV
jgi:Methyltransferase domain